MSTINIQTKSDSVRNALNEINNHVGKGGEASMETAVDRSRRISEVYSDVRDKLVQVLNAAATNTISADLKRVLILNETVRDFAIRVLPLRLLATVFENVPLEGTDEVAVSYFQLQGNASKDFVDGDGTGGTGYQFGQNTNTGSKKITVNKRKYQPLDYSSAEFLRQPFFSTVQLGKMNAERLGADILTDILSVITAAKYGDPAKSIAAAAYTSDDIVELKGIATKANWPEIGRVLIGDTDLETTLGKDQAYKLALNIGTTDVIQNGQFPKLSGFRSAFMPSFPDNGENLLGFIGFSSAIASAFAPVKPAPGVRKLLVDYQIATDLASGISMNYRHWGSPQADRDFEVIESAYGYEALLAAALKRLTRQ